jgi:hypothetical protein
MKRVLLILAIVLLPSVANAAVGFGAISAVSTSQTPTSGAVSGSNTVGLVYVAGETASDQITAVTWNGVSMTKIAAVQVPSDRWISAWCINNPASATTISFTGGTFWRSFNSYYTGTSCPVDSSGANTSSVATVISATTNIVASGSWAVMFQKDGAGGKTYTATAAVNTVRANADAGGLAIADSNAATSTGSNTGTMTATGTTGHGAIIFSLAPVAGAATTPILNLTQSFWIY